MRTDPRAEAAGLPPAVVVGLGTDQLRDVAAARGGTTNGLITAIAADVAHSVDDYRARTLRLTLPVSLRESDDPSAGNKIARADYELDLPEGTRYTDLAEIRQDTTYLTFQPAPPWNAPLASHLDRELQHWALTPRPTTW
ncbi:hypothetical protein [Nocardia transvalensis]|uniref:hypothetical protein n=1 Tax=Nocardia transvalensis TaxID=37333 RepID=UPI0018931500|nr:hypothetical protein [Nocardia transvalensis]MBF6331938.1 hypothetical protein [Nocardia transvalensis]